MDIMDERHEGRDTWLTSPDENDAHLSPARERRRDWETLGVIACCLLLISAVIGLWNISVPPRTVAAQVAAGGGLVAQPAPAFQLTDLEGNTVRLTDLKGKVVLINIWATWCPPCVRETPRLVRLATQYQDQGLVILGVNTTYQDSETAVRNFAAREQISYPVLLDPDNVVGRLYPTRLMPSTFLIDQLGTIRAVRVGEIDEKQMAEQVVALLAE